MSYYKMSSNPLVLSFLVIGFYLIIYFDLSEERILHKSFSSNGKLNYNVSLACSNSTPFISKSYNVWHTGSGGGLDFNQLQTSGPLAGYPSTFTQLGLVSNLPKREGGATFCDPVSGEVIIYSDGEKGWDKDGIEYATADASNRFNTFATNLSSASGTPLIIPAPGQCNLNKELYIYFTDDHLGATPELYYAIVDVPNRTISNPVRLINRPMSEQINAVQVNCDTTWIVYRDGQNLEAIRWTTSGFDTPVVSSGIHQRNDQRYRMAFNLDGTKFVATIGSSPDTSIHKVLVSTFDKVTGQFSNNIYLQPFLAVNSGVPYQNYGVAFSPNSSKLYLSLRCHSPDATFLVQYDLEAGDNNDIENSRILLSQAGGNYGFGGIINGPDGRIYISTGDGFNNGENSLHVIDYPDSIGLACNLNLNLIAPGGQVTSGLNNIVYGLGPASCLPMISLSTGGNACTEIDILIENCYRGAGGLYDIFYTLDGQADSVLNQSQVGGVLELYGLTPGNYTDIFIRDQNGCSSNIDSLNLMNSICPEICNNGIDDDLDGDIDCADADCISSPTISLSINSACVNETIIVSSNDIGPGTTYSWDFGANTNPATALGIGPHTISYTSCGSKTISLTVERNGCSITVDSIINIIDNINPMWDIDPQDLILECDRSANLSDSINLWLSSNGTGVASDNCHHLKITNNYSGLIPSCGSTANATVQFTATDSCGNSTVRTSMIQVLDTQAPFIQSVNDTLVDCNEIPSIPSLEVIDNCDTLPNLNFEEVIIHYPTSDWKNTTICIMLYKITSELYDNKGTLTTTDDELSFTLTIIGQNVGTGWSTTIAGNTLTGAYNTSYFLGPLLIGGTTINFTIIDNVDNSCTQNIIVDSNDF